MRLKHECFQYCCLLNSEQLISLSRRLAGKLLKIRCPVAAKHLSPAIAYTIGSYQSASCHFWDCKTLLVASL